MPKSDAELNKADDKRRAAQARKALPQNQRSGNGVADWANANPEMVLELVCAVAVEGGAVRFGYTRDGGAYSIGLYLGSDSKTYYCNDAEGINDQLRELIEYFKG